MSRKADIEKREVELIKQFESYALLGPLGIGQTITVDATLPVDVRQLAGQLHRE